MIAAAPVREAPPAFAIPPGSEAAAPPERRGVPRDGVRLLVVRQGGVSHRRFRDLPAELEAGDLLVVNTSATLPAALDATRRDGRAARSTSRPPSTTATGSSRCAGPAAPGGPRCRPR